MCFSVLCLFIFVSSCLTPHPLPLIVCLALIVFTCPLLSIVHSVCILVFRCLHVMIFSLCFSVFLAIIVHQCYFRYFPGFQRSAIILCLLISLCFQPLTDYSFAYALLDCLLEYWIDYPCNEPCYVKVYSLSITVFESSVWVHHITSPLFNESHYCKTTCGR